MFFLLIVLVVFAVLVVILYATLNGVYAGFQLAGFGADALAFTGVGLSILSSMDVGILMVAVGIGLASAIFAFALKTHPVFFVFFVLMQIVLIVIAGPIAGIFTAVAAAPGLTTAAANFPLTTAFLGNISVVMFLLSSIIAIVMFALPR
jgi:hypothetical protein